MPETTPETKEVPAETAKPAAAKAPAKAKAAAKKPAVKAAAKATAARKSAKPKVAKSNPKTSAPKSAAKLTGVTPMSTKSSAYKRMEASFEPIMDFNKMIAGSMESSYNMMMDSFQGYSKLGIDNMQAALKVRSPEDMMSFMESQNLMAHKASEMMMSDAKSMSDMSIKFFNDMRSLYESGVKTSMTAATEAMKAA